MAIFSLVASACMSTRTGDPGLNVGEQAVGRAERVVDLVHERAAHEVDDGEVAEAHEPPARRLLGVVRGAQDGRLGVELREDVRLCPRCGCRR